MEGSAALKLQNAIATEMDPINRALYDALDDLPAPARPIAKHIFDAGGKRLRPFLTVRMARLLDYDGDDIYRLAVSMEMLHAATLLHDDVLDNAASRRGLPAAHTIFPSAAVILAGDALLAHANAIVAGFGSPALSASFSRATSETAAGEILEISCLGRIDLTDGEYLEIARGKTGWLLAEACRMGAIRAGASMSEEEAALDFGMNLGLAFQIADDALDFAPRAITGKPTGGDAREGKFTPPLRLYRESLPEGQRAIFDRKFANGEIDEAEAEKIAEKMHELGIGRQVRNAAEVHLTRAREALLRLPGKPERDILFLMTDYVARREK